MWNRAAGSAGGQMEGQEPIMILSGEDTGADSNYASDRTKRGGTAFGKLAGRINQ